MGMVSGFLMLSSCSYQVEVGSKAVEDVPLEERGVYCTGEKCPPNDCRGMDVVNCRSADGSTFCVGLRGVLDKKVIITTYMAISPSESENCKLATIFEQYSDYMTSTTSGLWEWVYSSTVFINGYPAPVPACNEGQFPIPPNGVCFTVQVVEPGNSSKVYSCYSEYFANLPICNQ